MSDTHSWLEQICLRSETQYECFFLFHSLIFNLMIEIASIFSLKYFCRCNLSPEAFLKSLKRSRRSSSWSVAWQPSPPNLRWMLIQVFSRFCENEPSNQICSHLSEKWPNGRKEKKRKKTMVTILVFIMATLTEEVCLLATFSNLRRSCRLRP